MHTYRILLISILYFSLFPDAIAQREDLSQVWPAVWVEPAEGTSKDYAVSYFRKTFDLVELPDSLIVHSTGDQIYQLFVNGQFVTRGPQTGDLRHWHYETTDIRPFLVPGKNVIAAAVLNYGSHPPDARLTVQTGLLLAADNIKYRFLNTGESCRFMFLKH
jgi:alpha-L-rhamnosidase